MSELNLDELKRYVKIRGQVGGLDPEIVTTINALGGEASIRISSLKAVIAEIESLKVDLHTYMDIAKSEANEAESLRKQLEEAKTARDFNARQCLQMQDEIVAQGVILRNTIAAVNDQERTIHDLRSSVDADIERAMDAAFEQEIKRVSTVEYNSNEICRIFYTQFRAAVLAQLKEQKNGNVL
jgi:hypothetical protein